MSAPNKLTAYQERCLRLASERGRYLLLEHEVALRRLTEFGFVSTDRVGFGAVWFHPLPAGIAHIQQRAA